MQKLRLFCLERFGFYVYIIQSEIDKGSRINPKCCGAGIKNLALRFLQIHIYGLRHLILTELFLPDFILEHFDFKGIIVDEETFNIELEEPNNPPSEWEGIKVHSNGFLKEINRYSSQ